MRFASLALAATLMLTGIGCHHNLAKNGCGSCQGCTSGGHGGFAGRNGGFAGGHGGGGGGFGGAIASHMGGPAPTPVARLPHGYDSGPGGPPSATYAYPYYTTRAPRDFLMANPPSIGP